MRRLDIAIAPLVLLTLASGCSWKTLAYTPDPTRVENPEEEFRHLVMTAKRWRPDRIDFQPTFVALFYASIGHTLTLPFNEIVGIEIITDGTEFGVRATDDASERLYEYVAMDRARAERFADVLTALADKHAPTGVLAALADKHVPTGVLAAPPQRAIVAVFDLQDLTGSLAEADVAGLTHYLATLLTEAGPYKTVPRDQLRERLFEEKTRTYRACFDESCQLELGKALAAEKSLTTTLIKVGDRCALTARLFDLRTETADKAASLETDCGPQNLMSLVKQLAEQLAGSR
jgi:hypothetical protein